MIDKISTYGMLLLESCESQTKVQVLQDVFPGMKIGKSSFGLPFWVAKGRKARWIVTAPRYRESVDGTEEPIDDMVVAMSEEFIT